MDSNQVAKAYRMAEIEDRLTPQDGLNNYNIVLSRMELPTHGSARFTFILTDSMLQLAELEVSVPAGGQSLDRMTVAAHDALIDILRQLTFRADKARAGHARNAGSPAAAAATGELDFGLDRPVPLAAAEPEHADLLS